MEVNRKFYALGLLFLPLWIGAQETLNSNDPNTYIFGGDQKSATFSLETPPIALVDVEAEDRSSIQFGEGVGSVPTEAGSPPSGFSSEGKYKDESLWLNYSYRGTNGNAGVLVAYLNQSLPAGMTLEIEIIDEIPGGKGMGTPLGGKTLLTQAPQEITSPFGNGYTGDGEGFGFQLKYTLKVGDENALPPGTEVVFEIITP